MGFRKAQRRKAKLRLAITGTAGSGKNALKRWLSSVEEAVEDWNSQKGEKGLCLRD